MLEAGMKAPDFSLLDQAGNTVTLGDFQGKKVVLYFYSKDNTPGCTRQACAFAASYDQFRAQDVVVIGISKDSVASHQKFAQKYQLPFGQARPALCAPVRPGAAGHSGLRCLEGKEALRKGEHGRGADHLYHRCPGRH